MGLDSQAPRVSKQTNEARGYIDSGVCSNKFAIAVSRADVGRWIAYIPTYCLSCPQTPGAPATRNARDDADDSTTTATASAATTTSTATAAAATTTTSTATATTAAAAPEQQQEQEKKSEHGMPGQTGPGPGPLESLCSQGRSPLACHHLPGANSPQPPVSQLRMPPGRQEDFYRTGFRLSCVATLHLGSRIPEQRQVGGSIRRSAASQATSCPLRRCQISALEQRPHATWRTPSWLSLSGLWMPPPKSRHRRKRWGRRLRAWYSTLESPAPARLRFAAVASRCS